MYSFLEKLSLKRLWDTPGEMSRGQLGLVENVGAGCGVQSHLL